MNSNNKNNWSANLKKICVIMSTYNGEKYIDEQIASILDQENVIVDLYIRDDGSDKVTIDKLLCYESFPNVSVIYGKNVGYTRSFLSLLNSIRKRYDYYAFADQDDVWFKDKLYRASKVLNKYNGPCLYCAQPQYTDSDLKVCEQTNTCIDKLPFGSIDYKIIFHSCLIGLGCTMVFNNLLKETLVFSDENMHEFGHDNLTSLVAASIGAVYRDNEKVLFYRQHINNLSGNKTKHIGTFPWLKERINNLVSNKNFLMRKYVYNHLKNYGMDNSRCIELFRTIEYNKSIVKKIRFIYDYFPEELNHHEKLKFVLKVILGTY